jgi:hypothetical protein
MMFFGADHDCFGLVGFLQMGRDYALNQDGYVYVYGANGALVGKNMNELVMCRVPRDRITSAEDYEYFAGHGLDGEPRWSPDIDSRQVVHVFPADLVPDTWPLSWVPSVAYVESLGVYLMANCSGIGGDCRADEPPYFDLWVADRPWGPWRQIHEDTAWTPGGDASARVAAPLIAPGWISDDGRSFWLVWCDVQKVGNAPVDIGDAGFLAKTEEELTSTRKAWGEAFSFFGLKAERIDLTVG